MPIYLGVSWWLSGVGEHLRNLKCVVHDLKVMGSNPGQVENWVPSRRSRMVQWLNPKVNTLLFAATAAAALQMCCPWSEGHRLKPRSGHTYIVAHFCLSCTWTKHNLCTEHSACGHTMLSNKTHLCQVCVFSDKGHYKPESNNNSCFHWFQFTLKLTLHKKPQSTS